MTITTEATKAPADRSRRRHTFFSAPFHPRTRRELLHLLLDLPIGIAGCCFVAVSLCGGLLLAVLGLPVVAAMLVSSRAVGTMERARARALLGEHVAAPRPLTSSGGGFWSWLKAALLDAPGWRAALYLVLLGGWSLVVGAVLAPTLTAAGMLVGYPIWHNFGQPGGGINLGDHVVEAAWEIALSVGVGLTILLLVPWLVRGLTQVDRLLVRGLLGPTTLSSRVRSLEVARGGAIDQAAADLRRIERDLHDGTQARLVALAMELGMAREKLAENPEHAQELIAKAHTDAKEAVAELRDIARGIHPVELTGRGLDAALSPLAARCTVPMTVRVDLPGRPAPIVEAAAYFCVSELLTNISKHSRASQAGVYVHKIGDRLRIEVRDDGIGGADPSGGTGLRGLADRVRSLDGTVQVVSPISGTTTVVVELPWTP